MNPSNLLRCRRCRLRTAVPFGLKRHCGHCRFSWRVHPRGGRRTGAGAPLGNTNALRTGDHSAQLRAIVNRLALRGPLAIARVAHVLEAVRTALKLAGKWP